jgi:uncharacterized protein YerC
MAQVSKYPISNNTLQSIFDTFIQSFTELSNTTESQKFILDLLTPTEQIMLAKRVYIAILLMKGYEYRDIQTYLKVSSGTIAVIANTLQEDRGGFRKILQRIISKKNITSTIADASSNLVTPMARGGIGSGSWKYLKQELIKIKKQSSF